MKNTEANRLTRVQVQEKLKRNFQALCARCPQLASNYEVLDDSLTSLHWLSNLNVSIGSPATKDLENDGNGLRNHALLPPFPSNVLKNGLQQSGPHQNGSNLLPSGEIRYTKRNWNIQAPKETPISATKLRTTGHRKHSAKNGRNASAPTFGRPNPPRIPVESNQRVLHSASVASSKMLVRGLPINPLITQVLQTPVIANEVSNHTNPTWLNNLPHPKLQMETRSVPQSQQLPQISAKLSNKQLPGLDEVPLPSASPTSQYTFSPREVMLDILPGQIDYKNNPHVKPSFSYNSLICMALQSSKKRRMTISSICKWIADNFMYYRYADPRWQNSVKLNLTQSKFFTKVPKKESSTKSYLWEINPNSNIKLQDATSPLLFGNLRRNDPRLEPVQISPASSISLPSVPILSKYDMDEGGTTRKRKQTTPQKNIRRRSGNAKKRRNNTKSAGNRNVLQEEAPWLGSLKGDYNWSTLLDELTPDTPISITPTSIASRPSTNEGSESRDVGGQLTDDVTAGTLLALDMLSLPDIPEPDTNNENDADNNVKLENSNEFSSWKQLYVTAVPNIETKPEINDNVPTPPHTISKISDLHTLDDCELIFPDSNNDSDFDSLNGFLNAAADLDLTVTGKQIEPPPEWIPVNSDLETILCETQNDEVIYQHPSDHFEIDDAFSLSISNQSNTDQYLSLTEPNNKRKQKSKKTEQTHNGVGVSERSSSASRRQQKAWKQNFLSAIH